LLSSEKESSFDRRRKQLYELFCRLALREQGVCGPVSSFSIDEFKNGLTSRKKREHTDMTYDDMEKINNSDLINVTRLLKRQKRQIEAVKRLHESCRSPKRLINLKRLGRIKASNLPSHFLKEFKFECPVCLASSRKRKLLPGVTMDIEEKKRSSPNGKWFTWTRVENIQLDPLEAFIIIRSSLTERMVRRSSSVTRKKHIFL
jgi:hypothetical protein